METTSVTWPQTLRTRPPTLAARIGAAVLWGAVEIGFTALAARHQPDRTPLDAPAIGLLLAGLAMLPIRRRYPKTALAVAHVSTLGYWVLDYPGGPVFIAMILTLFTAIVRGGRSERVFAWASLGWGFFAFPWLPYLLGDAPRPTLSSTAALAAWLLVLGGAAEGVRFRRQRTIEMARAMEQEHRRRASEERLRIARELHDVLAHDISMINVQAGVALHLMDERPEQARTSLAAIKEASKDALSELRSALEILRNPGEQEPREPATGLDRLEELVGAASAAGLTVRTEVEGTPRPLPAGLDLAAFRIVQEALTNVIRHARATTATVAVRYADDELVLRVEDDGEGANGQPPSGGSGIAGMRERAAALGGELDAGPRPEGGFRIRARLPLDGRP